MVNRPYPAKAVQVLQEKGKHKAAKATGVISCFEVLSLKAFIERIGSTASGVIEMRRRGLVVRRDGGRIVVHGQDYCDYVLGLPVAELNSRDSPDGEIQQGEPTVL